MNFDIINYILLGIILLIITSSACLYYFILMNKKPHEIAKEFSDKIEHTMSDQHSDSVSDSSTVSSKSKKSKPVVEKEPPNNANLLLDFDNIMDDMVISNNNTVFHRIVECKGINLDLMSDEEKFSIEQSFIELVKEIEFPFKIHIQTRTLNYNNNIETHQNTISQMENDITKMVDQFNQLQASGSDKETLKNLLHQIQKKQRVYEYSRNLVKQIEALSNNNYTLNKSYYVVVSCSDAELGISSGSSLEQKMELAYSELTKRCNLIISGLQKSLVQAYPLKSYQLAELLYNTFNQDDENLLKLRSVLDTGIIRLYSSNKKV